MSDRGKLLALAQAAELSACSTKTQRRTISLQHKSWTLGPNRTQRAWSRDRAGLTTAQHRAMIPPTGG